MNEITKLRSKISCDWSRSNILDSYSGAQLKNLSQDKVPILTEVFMVLLNSYGKMLVYHLNQAATTSFQILLNSSFIYHLTFQH